MDLHNETPPKSKIVNKVLTSSVNCDSPFRLLPNISTPPSRFSRILNPFEAHLVERLHLPTFSPTVFAKVSTPKTSEKFKWTIDDISSLKPADIDENTISQHITEHDSSIESLVQEKIERFFSDKAIVPSPLNDQVKAAPLLTSPLLLHSTNTYCDGATQTVLSLPPILPKHVEDILKPYFLNLTDQKEIEENSSFYRKLFDFEEEDSQASCISVKSSPALSTGLSPIQLSPHFGGHNLNSSTEVPELRECTLSPIGMSPKNEGRSACRLNFSGEMSIDPSIAVPDIDKSLNFTRSFKTINESEGDNRNEVSDNFLNDWEMEYKQVSILSKSPVSSPEIMDSSNSNTPHSKIITSQRKRLSDSFKNELENEKDVVMEEEQVYKRLKNKLNQNEGTDTGYLTGGTISCDGSLNLFASTPTKKQELIIYNK